MKIKQKPAARVEEAIQLLIILKDTDPLVWRRIQVPAKYSFWDLHVAIQDAMGWQDSHLHEFVLFDTKNERLLHIGIPDEDTLEELPCLAGWKTPIERYLNYGVDPVRYRYDFGDDWKHTLEFEGMVSSDGGTYPRCVAGAGSCPPEDVGGTRGYAEFMKTIRNKRHKEREEMLAWAGGSFDPHEFNAESITFDDPQKRWKTAFEER